MLTIHPSSRFKRSYKKLPRSIKEDFAQRIILFQQDPFDPHLKTHKLKGDLFPAHAFCLRDGYRVLFTFETETIVVLINIGKHDDYAKW